MEIKRPANELRYLLIVVISIFLVATVPSVFLKVGVGVIFFITLLNWAQDRRDFEKHP